MRASSIRYLVKEGFKNIFNNKLMTMASVGVLLSCLVITGAAGLFSLNLKIAIRDVEQKNNFAVYLDKDISKERIGVVGSEIRKIDNVDSCIFFSKEEAIEKYREELGPLFDGLQGDDNPLPDTYNVSVRDLSEYKSTLEKISLIQGVESISDRTETVESLVKLDRLVTNIGFWIILILSAVSLFIVSNTISVTMYSRRLEISIMKSVGATDRFIRIPFVVEGMSIGLISALISFFGLWLLYDVCMNIMNQILPISHLSFSSMSLQVALIFALVGIMFGILGGLISIRKYLKKNGGDIIGI